MRLIISPQAERDIEKIGDYIAQNSPSRALRFVRELHNRCKTIAANPLGYRLRTELDDDIRSCAHRSYVIFFSVDADRVLILRALHGARDVGQILSGNPP